MRHRRTRWLCGAFAVAALGLAGCPRQEDSPVERGRERSPGDANPAVGAPEDQAYPSPPPEPPPAPGRE